MLLGGAWHSDILMEPQKASHEFLVRNVDGMGDVNPLLHLQRVRSAELCGRLGHIPGPVHWLCNADALTHSASSSSQSFPPVSALSWAEKRQARSVSHGT